MTTAADEMWHRPLHKDARVFQTESRPSYGPTNRLCILRFRRQKQEYRVANIVTISGATVAHRVALCVAPGMPVVWPRIRLMLVWHLNGCVPYPSEPSIPAPSSRSVARMSSRVLCAGCWAMQTTLLGF